jgi:hypothetical protein
LIQRKPRFEVETATATRASLKAACRKHCVILRQGSICRAKVRYQTCLVLDRRMPAENIKTRSVPELSRMADP